MSPATQPDTDADGPEPSGVIGGGTARREHLRIAAIAVFAGPGLLGILLVALALAVGLREFLVPGALALVTAGLLWLVRRRLAKRSEGSDPAQEPEPPGRFAALMLTLLGAGAVAVWDISYAEFRSPLTMGMGSLNWLTEAWIAGFGLLSVVVLFTLARFYGTTRTTVLAEAAGLASWLRVTAWLTLLNTAARTFGAEWPRVRAGLSEFEAGLVVVLLAEGLLIVLFSRRAGRLALAQPLSLRIFFGRFEPISSVFAFLTEAFGIDLRGSWALAFIRRSLAPTALALGGLAWVGSAFTVVGPAEVGVIEVFGSRADRAPVSSGLHIGWPWPIEKVQRVSLDRVHSLPIGFTGAKPGASLLWTAQHAQEEYKLLLGDGHDLISFNATLQFQVRDALAYVYTCSNPEQALAAVADRVLMAETVGRDLDGALSENLSELADQIEERIQRGADELGLGLAIVDLTLMGLHPPVNVAKDYQAVVGARIDRNTSVLKAQAYTEEVLPGARAQANRSELRAQAEATVRVALARGESEAFKAILETYLAAPGLFTFRRLLEAREAQLKDRSFAVIDQRFERDGGALWINGFNAENPTPAEDF